MNQIQSRHCSLPHMHIVTVAMTKQGRGNRNTSKFLRLEISNIVYLFIYFNIIISERENVVKLYIDVRWTSNVTCGKFERCRDSNINVMVFCCEIHCMKSLKNSKLLTTGFWAEQHVLIKIPIEVGRIPVWSKNDGLIFLSSQCFKGLSL